MDRVRDLLAVLFVAYAVGAAITFARAPPGPSTPPFVENPALAGFLVAVASGLAVAGLAFAAGAVGVVVRSPREIKLALVLGAAFLGFVAVTTWVAAPFDVAGEQWIPSDVTSTETALLRLLSVGLLAVAGAVVSLLYVGRGGGWRRDARTQ